MRQGEVNLYSCWGATGRVMGHRSETVPHWCKAKPAKQVFPPRARNVARLTAYHGRDGRLLSLGDCRWSHWSWSYWSWSHGVASPSVRDGNGLRFPVVAILLEQVMLGVAL